MLLAALLAHIGATAQEKIINPDISYAGTPRTCVIGGMAVSGVEGYEDYMLTGISGLSVGQKIQVPGSELSDAVKRYWRHGLFSKAQIAADSIVGDKIYLHFYLALRPRVSTINYEGVKKSEREDLEAKLGLLRGSQITPNMIDRAEMLAKRYFDDKGYKNAEVKIMQREDVVNKNQVILDIVIDKKEKMKVRQIIIEGNKYLTDSKIKGGLFKKGAFKKIHEAGKLSSFLKSKKYTPERYEEDKKNLADFSLVIMINLSVALVTSYLFIPSLLDRFPIKRSSYSLSVRRRRRVVKWNRLYSGYIDWGQRHRWVFVAVLVAGFGIPLCVLPAKVAEDKPQEQWNFWERTYNSIMGWRPYADNKNTVDKVVGTSFAMFHKAMNKGNFYREPGRDVLYVNAGMPEGCTVGQLNDVVTSMENYLSQFDQIESFTTNIYSYDNAMIEVRFKPEFEKTSFPAELKAQVMAMASNFGGATWRVWGINDSYFNNNVTTSYKSNRITLTGYNYDDLIGYAEVLVDKLSGNRRVSEPEIMSGGWSGFAGNEFNIGYDFEKMAAVGLSPYRYYSVLYSMLYDQGMRDIMINGEMTSTVLRSSQAESFDLWNVQNSQVSVDSLKVKLSEIGSIEKKRTGLSIYRHNQSYEVTVGYDFIGSYELSKSLTETTVKYMNEEVLPVGYKAEVPGYWWGTGKQIQYAWLLLLIIAIIYVMCAMTFESLRLPFAVILMIPVSFIGVFLVFGAFDFPFDQGGFAAFVMLSGIVVNAGIYLINQFQDIRSSARRRRMRSLGYDASCKDVQDSSGRFAVRQYVKAYNHKINPTMLTIISTILGLIPFLFDGPEEVFWFAFATGTIGGMAFSVLALILYLPVFCFRVKRPGRKSKTHPERA